MVEVFNHPFCTSYRTVCFSKACGFYFLCFILTFIPPLLVAYRSEGFWKKSDVYLEQPHINFKHEMILLLETENLDQTLAWSTDNRFNLLMQDQARIPSIKSSETDWNRDGIKDYLDLEIKMPLTNRENVYGIKLMVFFDVKFHFFSQVGMEAMAYLCSNSGMPSSRLDVVGDLTLVQKQPLAHKGRDLRYAKPVIGEDRIDDADILSATEKYSFRRILQEYNARNVSMRLTNDYLTWERGSVAGLPFTASLRINYPTQTVTYRPGFWQMIKWAWVQYLAVLVIFIYVFKRVKEFVFTKGILTTRIYYNSLGREETKID